VGGVTDEDDAARCPGRRHDLLDGREVRPGRVLEQARHRVGEVGERLAPVLALGTGRVARIDVRVAVHGPLAERDGKERAASAQHGRPIADVEEAVGHEPPRRLSYVAGWGSAQRKAANRRMDAVSADDDVVAATRAIGESHPGRIALPHRGHRHAQPDR
jgi:hypothetical protein